jgi:hypothetical protein
VGDGQRVKMLHPTRDLLSNASPHVPLDLNLVVQQGPLKRPSRHELSDKEEAPVVSGPSPEEDEKVRVPDHLKCLALFAELGRCFDVHCFER